MYHIGDVYATPAGVEQMRSCPSCQMLARESPSFQTERTMGMEQQRACCPMAAQMAWKLAALVGTVGARSVGVSNEASLLSMEA
jgi:hypothetical protein